MKELVTLPLPFWASVITALGWLYSAFAVFWPRLFYRDILRHTTREELGYRLGRAIYWRLPRGPALLIATLSVLPWLALLFGPGLVAKTMLVLATAALLLLWLTQPPGQRLGIIERPHDGQGRVFELRASRSLLRASVVLIVFGIIPAMIIGASVSRVVSLWAPLTTGHFFEVKGG